MQGIGRIIFSHIPTTLVLIRTHFGTSIRVLRSSKTKNIASLQIFPIIFQNVCNFPFERNPLQLDTIVFLKLQSNVVHNKLEQPLHYFWNKPRKTVANFMKFDVVMLVHLPPPHCVRAENIIFLG